RNTYERHQVEPAAECELRLHRLEADAGMLHVVQDEFGARLAADRRIARREELERHGAERAAAGRKPRFYWIWAQRIFPRGSAFGETYVGPGFRSMPAVCRYSAACRSGKGGRWPLRSERKYSALAGASLWRTRSVTGV